MVVQRQDHVRHTSRDDQRQHRRHGGGGDNNGNANDDDDTVAIEEDDDDNEDQERGRPIRMSSRRRPANAMQMIMENDEGIEGLRPDWPTLRSKFWRISLFGSMCMLGIVVALFLLFTFR